MARTKIYATPGERSRVWIAKERARLRSLSPIQRLAESLKLPEPYTAEEAEDLAILKGLIAEVQEVSGRLNQSLASRLGDGSPFAAELIGYTRIQIPSY